MAAEGIRMLLYSKALVCAKVGAWMAGDSTYGRGKQASCALKGFHRLPRTATGALEAQTRKGRERQQVVDL